MLLLIFIQISYVFFTPTLQNNCILMQKCLDKRNLVCSWRRFGPSANKFFFATQTTNRHYYSRVSWDTLAATYILQESIKLHMSVFERRVVHVFALNSVGSRGLQVSFMPESDYSFIKSLASCQRGQHSMLFVTYSAN